MNENILLYIFGGHKTIATNVVKGFNHGARFTLIGLGRVGGEGN